MRFRVLLALAVLLLPALLFILEIEGEMHDFEVNYRAGSRLLAGESLYQTADGHYMFKYFPSSALFYAPLSLLPLSMAKAIWYGLTISAAVAVFVLSKRLSWDRESIPWLLAALPPLVLAKFYVVEFKLGQVNGIVTLLLLLTLRVSREPPAGALWGLATAMKPYGLIFLPYYMVRRRIAALASGLAVVAVASALPSIFYGLAGNLDLHRDWYRSLSESTPGQLASADNVSIAAFVTKWSLPPELAMGLVLGLAVVMLLMVRARGSVPMPAILEVATLLVLIPLVSPLGWDYQFVTSALAMTLLGRHWRAFPRPFQWILAANLAVIGLSIYDLIGAAAYHAFMMGSVLTLCFLLVVASLAYLRFLQKA
ncbi:MAG TPA: glycosyltransferase family 87 protein [Vicinamibacteria bacterium]